MPSEQDWVGKENDYLANLCYATKGISIAFYPELA